MSDSHALSVVIVRPETSGPEDGNRSTANRWEAILRGLGARVRQALQWDGRPADILIALHAVKSHPSIRAFHTAHPDAPIVLCGTGTDLYLAKDREQEEWMRESLKLATRIVLLQPLAVSTLPEEHRAKARVVLQSFPRPEHRSPRPSDRFQVALLANIRGVKDPLIAAEACRSLPDDSKVHVVHAGSAIDLELSQRVQEAADELERFETRGALSHSDAIDLISGSHLLLSTSRQEGGANVLSEALACGTPIAATAIPGNLGILGEDYPATFPPANASALASLLLRCERDQEFYRTLERTCERLAPKVDPGEEVRAWSMLLEELRT